MEKIRPTDKQCGAALDAIHNLQSEGRIRPIHVEFETAPILLVRANITTIFGAHADSVWPKNRMKTGGVRDPMFSIVANVLKSVLDCFGVQSINYGELESVIAAMRSSSFSEKKDSKVMKSAVDAILRKRLEY